MFRSLVLMVTLAVTGFGVAEAGSARLQVFHNAADPAAAVVDIYVNGDLFLNDFDFREATPFVDVPAGVELNIGVAPGDSDGPEDIIASFPVTLEHGKRYLAVANGVLDPGQFADNPNGASIAFTLFAQDGVRESSPIGFLVNLRVFHGSTDAPEVDVVIRDRPYWPLVRHLQYGEFSRPRYVFPRSIVLDITPAGMNETIVASFAADLSGLRGGAAAVVASGFLNPGANQGGPAFGLFAILPDGTVIELPAIMPMAKLQIIHNAADPGAAIVDVWVNDSRLLDDFAFRAATPFVDVPANVTLDVGIAPPDSDSPDDAIANFDVTLEEDGTYVAIANGVLDPSMFAPNPDGREIAFTLFSRDRMKTSAFSHRRVKVIGFHGASDAPSVDIIARPGGRSWWTRRVVNNAGYGDFGRYKLLRARSYVLDVTLANDNSAVVASYEADLSGLGGGAAVVFASGFLSPGDNQGGAAFGLFAALPDGTVIELPAVGGAVPLAEESIVASPIVPPLTTSLSQNRPNPFNPITDISFALGSEADVRLTVMDIQGRVVRKLVDERMPAGEHSVRFDANGLSSGAYYYRLDTGKDTQIKKMLLLK